MRLLGVREILAGNLKLFHYTFKIFAFTNPIGETHTQALQKTLKCLQYVKKTKKQRLLGDRLRIGGVCWLQSRQGVRDEGREEANLDFRQIPAHWKSYW